jgi:hypothetical protein
MIRRMELLASLSLAGRVALGQGTSIETWFETSYVTDLFSSKTIVRCGSEAVTPVPTFTAYALVASYVDEPVASRDVVVTTWITITVIYLMATKYIVVFDSSACGNVVTSNTSTSTIWTSPTIASINLPTISCTDGVSLETTETTETTCTGSYLPISGQVLTLPTTWPTAVISVFNVTAVYRRLTYVGTRMTPTLTAVADVWLLTTTMTTTEPTPAGRYPRTIYLSTTPVTSSDWQ